MLERQKTTAALDDFVQDCNTKQEKINAYDMVYSLTPRFSLRTWTSLMTDAYSSILFVAALHIFILDTHIILCIFQVF
jgi:hypothetical protein